MGRKVLIGVLILGCAVAAVLLIWRPLKAGTGIYIAAGSPIILFDGGSGEPVVMQGRTGDEDMFGGLETGDRILIFHDGTMMLSYPAQMNVFFCIRLEKGDEASVPEEVMESLKELGWL